MVGSRSICCRNGFPQYDSPRWSTRIGHRSQTSARAVQFTEVGTTPSCRSRAPPAFAIAREALRKLFPVQDMQNMKCLSDVPGKNLN